MVLVGFGTLGAHADTNSGIVATDNRTQELQAFCRGVRGAQLWAHTELYFGLSIQPEGTVISEEQYQQFLDTEVTPRFPDGFTVLSGRGQFRNASGTIVREPSKVLVLFYPFTRAQSAAIDAIRTAYVNQFRQESVLRADEPPACVAF
jgi:hypothetical protein